MAVQAAQPGIPDSGLREPSFVGREGEIKNLVLGLKDAELARGSTWLVEGPVGIGKTALLREIQSVAAKQGFATLSGYGLREVNTAFFLFQQVFRSRAPRDRAAGALEALPSVAILEEERPDRTIAEGVRASTKHSTLFLVRDRPATIRERHPTLAPTASMLWLTRAEGPEVIAPSNLDSIGERLSAHLESQPDSVVVIAATEYLVTQNGFQAVLRLLQFLRDVAESTSGHLLIALNPSAHEAREVSLLEGEGEVVKGAPGAEAKPAPQNPTQVMLAYLDALESEARRQPQLLVLDDMQWADPDSIRTFQFLARNARNIPVVILASLRTGEERSQTEAVEGNVLEVLDAMDREGTLHRIHLFGLSEGETGRFLGGMLTKEYGAPIPSGKLTGLIRKSQGNPFVLREMISQMASDGSLREVNGELFLPGANESTSSERTDRAPLPETVRRLVSRRLGYHNGEERDLLQWAAVEGSEFRLAPLSAVMKRPPEEIARLVRELSVHHHILESREVRGEDIWAFTQPLVWEIVRDEIPEAQLRSEALALAEWWAVNLPEDVETVARLFHEAGDPKRGLPWIRRAIEQAVQSRAMETIERYHRWLQDLHVSSGTPAEKRLREGLDIVEQIEERIGDSSELVRLLRVLLELTTDVALRTELEAHMSLPLAWVSPKEAAPIVERVREAVSKPVAGSERIGYLLYLAEAVLALRNGKYEEQWKAAKRASQEPGAPLWARYRSLYYTGTSLCRLGRVGEADAVLAELERLPRAPSEPRYAAYVSGVRVFIAEARGDVATQVRENESAVALMGVVGNQYSMVVALMNLGEAKLTSGDVEGVRQVVHEMRKLVERFDLPLRHIPLLLEGRLCLREHHWKDAIADLTQGLQYMHQHGNYEGITSVHFLLSESYLWSGDLGKAREELHAIDKDRDRDANEFDIPRPLVEGWLAEASGQSEDARTSLESGLDFGKNSGSRLWEALALNSMARWLERHGDPSASEEKRKGAVALFDAAGIRKDGWPRNWPPALPVRPAS